MNLSKGKKLLYKLNRELFSFDFETYLRFLRFLSLYKGFSLFSD